MTRIYLRYARATMHLAEAATGPDGAVIAGAGTTLTRAVVKALAELGVESVRVREADAVRDWEEHKEPERAVADLEARLAREPADAALDAIRAALRRRLLAGDRPADG